MKNLFINTGNFLFRTRNVLFPAIMAILFIVWSPTAINSAYSPYLLATGLTIITIGQALRVLTIGLAYIIRGGRNRRAYAEKLVSTGLFAHCRNPLYVGNILIASGFLFVSGNPIGIVVGTVVFSAIYRLIVYNEEAFLEGKFGQEYRDYCAKVPRWVPIFRGIIQTIESYEFDWPAVVVKEYGTLMTSLIIPLGLITWKLHLVNLASNYQFALGISALLILSAYGYARFLKKTGRMTTMR